MDSLFGQPMPSLESSINKEADRSTHTDNGTLLTYYSFDEEDYKSFDKYLSGTDCTVEILSTDNRILVASISKDDAKIIFTYDYATKTASMLYPEGTHADDGKECKNGMGNVLPDLDELSVIIPRIDLVTDLSSTGLVDLPNGGFEEKYEGFTDSAYEAYSKYLKEYDCLVVDYKIDENDVLTIQLERNGIGFTMIYDKTANTVTMQYAPGGRPEPTPTPVPTLPPTPIPTSTPKTSYSESECWNTAEAYFKKLGWKNPDSLTIHGHSSSFSNNEYTFIIDYSAQNGFGGYNRKTAILCVNKLTNKVTTVWVDD